MTRLSEEILYNYQQRKTAYGKKDFRDYLKTELKKDNIEVLEESDKGIFKSTNMLIGDPKSAKIIFTAHYDTQALFPLPNFIAPNNLPLYILYITAVILVVFVFGLSASLFLWGEFNPLIAIGCMVLLVIAMIFGRPSDTTANDNSSGVITLIEIIKTMPTDMREGVAFVFFDNNCKGLSGSSFFAKKYADTINDKLIINFDCVGEGFNMMFICGEGVLDKQKEMLQKSFLPMGKMMPIFSTKNKSYYNSDHLKFKNGIGVISLKKNKLLGYYVDKIKTTKDTVFQRVNAQYLAEGAINLLSNLNE